MQAAGVAIGLVAALLQSCSYVITARYVREGRGGGTLALLAPAFALMSVVSLPAVLLLLPERMPPASEWMLPATLCVGCAMAAHFALFLMQRAVDASRVSPLLTMKVPILAVFGMVLFGDRYTPMQWAGVALVIVSAWLLCKAGRDIPLRALAWLFLASIGYAFSDICIKLTLEAFAPVCGSLLHRSLLTVFVCYLAGGIYGFAGLAFVPRTPRRVFVRHVVPYAAVWLVAMIVLFACFSLIGIVQGNIVQSARGLISVVMGWSLARAGLVHLEERVSRAVFVRRVVSALLIVLAIALFNLGRA